MHSTNVIYAIHQFLKDQNLIKSLTALESETGVKYELSEDCKDLRNSILMGKWDKALLRVNELHMSYSSLYDMYILIALEMKCLKEIGVSRTIVKQTPTMLDYKKKDPDRYSQVNKAVFGDVTDLNVLCMEIFGCNNQEAREKVACGFSVHNMESNYLVRALSSYSADTFLETCTLEIKAPIMHKRPIESRIMCSVYSVARSMLVVGMADGFVEIVDPKSMQLDSRFGYQETLPMVMEGQITSLETNGTTLLSGDSAGTVCVWNLDTGECMRNFSAGNNAIEKICMLGDKMLCMLGKSVLLVIKYTDGKVLARREEPSIRDCCWTEDKVLYITHGHVFVWDWANQSVSVASRRNVQHIKQHGELLLAVQPESIVCVRSAKLLNTPPFEIKCAEAFLYADISVDGPQIYALAEGNSLYSYDSQTGDELSCQQIPKMGIVIGICALKGGMIVYDSKGNISSCTE